MRYIIGIDPGQTGAIAMMDCETLNVSVVDMPIYKGRSGKTLVNSAELLAILEPPEDSSGEVMAVLEQVWSRPKEGVSSAFRFGQGYGSLQTALAAHQYPTHDVTPGKWKKHFGLSSNKGASRGLAIQRFPRQAQLFSRGKDDGRAEAALIALYGYEKLIK